MLAVSLCWNKKYSMEESNKEKFYTCSVTSYISHVDILGGGKGNKQINKWERYSY